MKDKEFKARNKDTDFSKKVEADTVLGRQSAKGSAKPFTSSEHNRYQQKFLDTEKPLDTSTVQNPSDNQEILKSTENNTEQQEDLENINHDSQSDISYSPPTSEPPKKGGFSNAVTTAEINGISANLIKRLLIMIFQNIIPNIPQTVQRKKRRRTMPKPQKITEIMTLPSRHIILMKRLTV